MMCKSQAEELRLRVLKYVSAIEVRQRMMYMEKIGGAMGNEIELKTGMLKIRKVEVGHHQGSRRAMLQGAKRLLEGGDWKERWCVLRGRRLLMFKKQTEDTPTQVGHGRVPSFHSLHTPPPTHNPSTANPPTEHRPPLYRD